MTHPYIPLYVDDYDAATAHLSAEEDGVYMRLLRLCWRTPGCSLPNDPAWIARKVRLSEADYERVAKPVIAEFFKLLRGRLVQRRLKDEYENISRKKLSRQNAGKKGGSAKSAKTKGNTPSNATVLLGDMRAFPNPEPDPKGSEDKSSDGGAVAPNFDKVAWDEALVLLTEAGLSEKQARAFFGKLLSQNGLMARDLLGSVSGIAAQTSKDPQGYLTAAARKIAERQGEQSKPKRVGFV